MTSLGYIQKSTTLNNVEITGEQKTSGYPVTDLNLGTAADGVTAVETGDGRHHVTTLTFSGIVQSPASAAALGYGSLLYTFPANRYLNMTSAVIELASTGSAPIVGDTPEIALGTATAESGTSPTLDGGTQEDIATVSVDACDGTVRKRVTGPAAYATGYSASQSVYLNMADTWAAAGTVTHAGTITLNWTDLGSSA